MPLALRVRRGDGQPGAWTSVNVSESGMFLAGPPTLPTDSQLRLALSVPGRDGEIFADARVVWTNGPGVDDELPVGMGVEFCDLDEDSLRLLRAQLYGNEDSLHALHTQVCGDEDSESSGRLEQGGELEPGTAIGTYRIDRLLGSGGMSSVYQAEHTGLGRKVALKRLHRRWAEDRDAVRRFFDEGRIVNRVRDDHVVEITDFFTEGTDKFYVMELLDGRPLDEVLRSESPLPLPRALDIAAQICDALAVIHDAGIVHRDLKPGNVFLVQRSSRRDFVKLLDFGIAKLRMPSGSLAETVPGVLVGTPTYIAPEYALGADPEPRADLYALGVVLYQLVTGRPVFVANTWAKMMVAHVHTEPTPASQLRIGGIPEALDRLILELLAKQPEDRPESAREVAGRLNRIQAEIDDGGLPWVEAEPLLARPVPLRRRWQTAGLVAAAVALLAVGLALLFGSGDVEPRATTHPAPRPPVTSEPPDAPPANEPRPPVTSKPPDARPANEPRPPDAAVAPSPAPAAGRRAKKSRARVHKRGTFDPFAH